MHHYGHAHLSNTDTMKSRLHSQPRSFDSIEREWENQQENQRSREMEEDELERYHEEAKAERELEKSNH